MVEPTPYSFLKVSVWNASRGQFFMLLTRGLGLMTSFLVLRTLSLYQFGLYQLILSVTIFIDSFDSGLYDDIVGNEIVRGVAEKRHSHAKRMFNEIFILKTAIGVISFAILLFGAQLIAQHYGKDIASYLRIISVIVLLNAILSVEGIVFRAGISFVAFGSETLKEMVKLVFLGWFWLHGGFGIREVLLATVIAASAAFVYITVFFIREYWRLFGGVVSEKAWLLIRLTRQHGFWVILRYGVSKIYKPMDIWLVRLFLSTEAVAIYSFTINLIAYIQTAFPDQVFTSFLPFEVHRERRFEYLYRRIMKYLTWSGIAVAVAAFVCVPIAVRILFPQYLPAIPLFRVMLVTIPLYLVYKFQKSLLVALREQRMLTMRLVTEMALTGVLLIILLPLIGLYAIVVEYLLTYGWRVMLYLVYLPRKYPRLKLKVKHILRFDRDDWKFFVRAIREGLNWKRWLGPIRIRV